MVIGAAENMPCANNARYGIGACLRIRDKYGKMFHSCLLFSLYKAKNLLCPKQPLIKSVLPPFKVSARQYLCAMDNKIEKTRKARLFLINQIEELSNDQLNKIPDGYNNNIIWNLIHLMSAQQSICYLRAGQTTIIADKYIAPFSTNTKPERIIEKQETEEIKNLFVDTIDRLQADYDKKIFSTYTPSPNIFKVYGIEIKSIDDALEFLLYHEGYHSGYILVLKKFVLGQPTEK